MPAAEIDTVMFDVGGVLAVTGRHSDFARRFAPEHAEAVQHIFLGDYGADGDHPWHRLERGEITLEENRRLNKAALAVAGIALPAPPAGGGPAIVFTRSEPMIALVEELGADSYLYGTRAGLSDEEKLNAPQIVARLQSRHPLAPNQTVRLRPTPDSLHVFSNASSKRISD